MSILIAALLGAVQGITEFLPVSSSAHLLLGRAALGWGEEPFGLVFDVATHLGTLVATIIYFRDDLLAMALALPRLFTDAPEARLMRLVAIGTIPVVIVGLLFADWIEAHARLPVVTIVTLSVGRHRAAPRRASRPADPRRRRPDAGRRDRLRPGPGGGADPRPVAVGQHDHGRHAARRPARRRGAVHVPARHSRGGGGARRRQASSCGTCR